MSASPQNLRTMHALILPEHDLRCSTVVGLTPAPKAVSAYTEQVLSTRRRSTAALAAVRGQQTLSSLGELYLTSCRIEGKSLETVRSYRESLDVFLPAVDEEGLPQHPASFITARVHQFVGCVADAGPSPATQRRKQRERRQVQY
jgi:hypothetical protein